MKFLLVLLFLILSSLTYAETFYNQDGITFEQKAGWNYWDAPRECRNKMVIHITPMAKKVLGRQKYRIKASMGYYPNCSPRKWWTAEDVIDYRLR